MTAFPTASSGILFARLGDHAVVYDPGSEVVHHLNASAATVLAACDGVTDIDDAVTTWADAAGADQPTVAADVAAGIEALRTIGLIGRTDQPEARARRVGSTLDAPGAERGAVHAVLDHGVVFRSTNRALVDRIDDYLGSADVGRIADIVFDVAENPDGSITLITDDEWVFPDVVKMFCQLTSVVNEYATRTRSCISLHAGGLRAPSGGVVVLPGAPGSGKSTLTAALVAAGWDYLGDEAIGARHETLVAISYPKRLSLDTTSRDVLGLADSEMPDIEVSAVRPDVKMLFGEVGPITRVVLPRYVAGAEATVAHLEPSDALDALLANTLNLGGAGQSGFETLCDLATTVPVSTLIHHDAIDAAQIVVRLVAGDDQ